MCSDFKWISQAGSSNFNITHSADRRFGLTSAIFVNGSNSSIIENSCWNTYIGISVAYSKGAVIQGNDCISNYNIGIKLRYSDWNTIQNNNCSYNEIGIELFDAHENSLINNSCYFNIPNLYDGIGIELDTSSENNISLNVCANNQFAGLVIDRSKNNSVSENNCHENGYGIYLDSSEFSNYSIVNNEICGNNWTGLRIRSSSGIEIRENIFDGNLYGVFLTNSDENDINNNTFTNHSIGCFLENGADSNLIADNSITFNEKGIMIEGSKFNEIRSNTIRRNTVAGLVFEAGDNNSLSSNMIMDNQIGIILQRHSKNNNGYLNFFIENGQGVNASDNDEYSFALSSNFWGDDSGPYHPEKNREGLGDTITDFVLFEPWLDGDGHSIARSDQDSSEEDTMLIPIFITGILSVSLLGIALHREDLRFLLLSLLTLPLYSRMERNDILDQSTRNYVYTEVVTRPGVNYSAMKSKLGLGTSSLVYHLEVLEREGYIRSKKEMGRKLFFPKGVVPTVTQEDKPSDSFVAPLPPSPVQEQILEYLKDNGPKSRTELKDALSLKQQTVSYSIRSLEKKGLVKTGGRGRNDLCEIIEK